MFSKLDLLFLLIFYNLYQSKSEYESRLFIAHLIAMEQIKLS